MSSVRTVYMRATGTAPASEFAHLIARGKDGRFYVLFDSSNWLCSFPTEGAAWRWLSTPPTRKADGVPDLDADNMWFESLGGEWAT